MGFDKEETSVHGFRALARTILDEVLGFRPDFIEHQLAHAVRDPLKVHKFRALFRSLLGQILAGLMVLLNLKIDK